MGRKVDVDNLVGSPEFPGCLGAASPEISTPLRSQGRVPMADPLRILYRSLGVPDALQEENKALSAAAKMRAGAEVENGPASSVIYTSNPRQAMLSVAARVLDSASRALL